MGKPIDQSSLIEEMARTIYSDSYTQYGTCSLEHWNKTSELQREFMRSAAKAVLLKLMELGLVEQGS